MLPIYKNRLGLGSVDSQHAIFALSSSLVHHVGSSIKLDFHNRHFLNGPVYLDTQNLNSCRVLLVPQKFFCSSGSGVICLVSQFVTHGLYRPDFASVVHIVNSDFWIFFCIFESFLANTLLVPKPPCFYHAHGSLFFCNSI